MPHKNALSRAEDSDAAAPGTEPACPTLAAGDLDGVARPRVSLWAGALVLVLACHLLIGVAWLARAPLGVGMHEAPAEVFDLDLAASTGASAPEPAIEPAADVPAPDIPPSGENVATGSAEAGEPPPSPESTALASTPQSPKEPLIATEERHERRRRSGSEREEVRTRERARQERALARKQADAAREKAQAARRRTVANGGAQPGGARADAPASRTAAGPPGASAAASAAWRNQIVGILRSRFAGGAGAGMAGVAFSVTRGGQIVGARLTASSGNGRIDTAALAAFRGSVPPPPSGYVGALSFNIRLGVR